MAFYGNYVFAGTSDNGMVIRSINRFQWENMYQTDDTLVTSLYVYNDCLYIGTSPNGKIYKIDLVTHSVKYYGAFNGKIIGFSELNDEFYASTSMPGNIYKFDKTHDKWDIFYKPYTNEINQVKTLGNKMYLACNGDNFISYNGTTWNVEINTSTIKNVSTKLFSHVNYNFIDTNPIKTTTGLNKETILDIFPYNKSIGINSIILDSNIILGSKNKARIYSYSNGSINIIFDTEGENVNCMLNIESGVNLASIDNKLYLILNKDAQKEKLVKPVMKYVGIPILELPQDEYISHMTLDDFKGVLFATSNGRILSCDKKIYNAYLTGERTVYSDIWDGYGNKSITAETTFMYSLYKRVLEITKDKMITNTRYFPTTIPEKCDKITAEFISPVLHIKQDFGLWKELLWEEAKPLQSDIFICIRVSDTMEALASSPWKYCFQSNPFETGVISRQLNNINISGQYIQIKAEMISYKKNITPMIANISIKYSTKKAFYFFTEKFSLEKDTNLTSGMMIANITKPINTEINFGITDKNSSNWNDYKTVDVEKLFSVDNYKNIKVGVKLVSYDTHIPSVDEFALIFGDEKKQII